MTSKRQLIAEIAEIATAKGLRLTAAESCTGGMVASAFTDISGSSAWFEYGFVTYSNEAKHAMLDVPETLFVSHGAVSAPVVEAMVQGALAKSGADFGVALSGIAGPMGGTPDKPVGTVWIAWGRAGESASSRCEVFAGDRAAVRSQAVDTALEGLLHLLRKSQ